MTEVEWLLSSNPSAMLRSLDLPDELPQGRSRMPSDRKLRLFAQNLRSAFMFEPTGEGYPDYPAEWLQGYLGQPEEMRYGKNEALLFRDIVGNPWRKVTLPTAQLKCRCGGEYGMLKKDFLPMLSQCRRCHSDGPFWAQVVEGGPCPWLTHSDGRVPKIARAIYDDRAWHLMPILGDALEEAGCDNEDILRHCRGWERCPRCAGSGETGPSWDSEDGSYFCPKWVPIRSPHVRGCWVLDLLLGQE